jgi:3-oxoacyl-[acyl-carrier-protein] synthase-3
MKIKARIRGTGSYTPERVLTNQDLEKMVETSDEWIFTRTGMKERRIARADESTSDMGAEAGKRALEAAGVDAAAVDLVLVATCTPDHPFPSTSCLIQAKLGATNAAAVDIQAACTGYIYALSMAQAFVEAGVYRTVLLIASEKLSAFTNYTDRNTCVLFGDGASACVVSAEGAGLAVRAVRLGADGALGELLIIPAGGARMPASQETVNSSLHYTQMEGKEVFKHAVRRMESATKECLEIAGLSEPEIGWFIPHQANLRIIEALAKRFQVSMDRVYLTIHKYGNTSASSLGIALDEFLRGNAVADGENIVITAFGSGLTWGSAVLTKVGQNG